LEIHRIEHAPLPATAGAGATDQERSASVAAYLAEAIRRRERIVQLAEELHESVIGTPDAPDWARWASQWASIGLHAQEQRIAVEREHHARACDAGELRRLLTRLDATIAASPDHADVVRMRGAVREVADSLTEAGRRVLAARLTAEVLPWLAGTSSAQWCLVPQESLKHARRRVDSILGTLGGEVLS
jgi:hypothetical protein